MAELTIERTPEADGEIGAGSIAFTVSGPVNVTALQDEAQRRGDTPTIVAEGDADQNASDEPTKVWFVDLDEKRATALLQAHDPNPEADAGPSEPQPVAEGSDAPGFIPPPEDQPTLAGADLSLVRNLLADDAEIAEGDRDKAMRIILRHLFWEDIK